jgi:two-component system KDP operon response regulator KdpE
MITMSTRPLRILVVDDDPAMVGAVTALVGTEGHQVITAYDGLTAVKRFREEHPDLVLLDLAMPGPDGFSVAGQMRAVGQAPIMIVSGESGEAAKVRALGLGADDYLTKPFGKAELLARIAAIMRRVDRAGPGGGPAGGPLEAGPLVLEPGRHEARVGETSLTLTPTEFRLLEALVRAGGDIVPHLQLARAGWPAETDPDLLWLKPHLARLRSKVEAAGGPHVVAVRGVGYRIVVEESRPGDRPRGRAGTGQTATAIGRPVASCAASAQPTWQPRASRPANGLKWNHASPFSASRQPHDAHVTGALRPSRTAIVRRVGSEGWIIWGGLRTVVVRWARGGRHRETAPSSTKARVTRSTRRRRDGNEGVAVGLRGFRRS